MPEVYTKIRKNTLGMNPQDWVIDHIRSAIRPYSIACKFLNTIKRFMVILKDIERIKKFDVNICLKIVEKVQDEGLLIVNLLNGTNIEYELIK